MISQSVSSDHTHRVNKGHPSGEQHRRIFGGIYGIMAVIYERF